MPVEIAMLYICYQKQPILAVFTLHFSNCRYMYTVFGVGTVWCYLCYYLVHLLHCLTGIGKESQVSVHRT